MYTVFSHSRLISYQTSVFSKATVFYILASLLTFIPPLLIAYRSQGFWQKVDYYREQPEVHFKHELLVLMETGDPEKVIGWGSFKNYNHLLGDRARTPLIKSSESDWNRDGKLDKLELKVEIPLRPEESVFSADLFLFFDVKLHRFSSVRIEGVAHVHAESSLPGRGFSYTGDLKIVQRQPLAHKGRDERFSDPVFDKNSVFADAYDFEKVFRKYHERNVTVRLDNAYEFWRRGSSAVRPFAFDIEVKYPEQTLTYAPGFWQMLKWAWVQYVSLLIVFVFVFRQIKTFVFSNQVFPTRRQPPVSSAKEHQF